MNQRMPISLKPFAKATMFKSILVTILAAPLGGCSVFMAANQPSKKDVDLFSAGTPRSVLVREFGEPISTEDVEGHKVEVFRFVQGYSKGAKASRAMFHGTADVLTFGLWEVVGTPAEAVFNGETLYYQVTYNDADVATEIVALNH